MSTKSLIYYLPVILLLAFTFVAKGETNSMQQCTPDAVDTLLKDAKNIMFSTPDVTLVKALEALNCSKSIGYDLGIAGAFKIFGSYYSDLTADYETSRAYIDSAMMFYKKAGGIKGKEGEGAIWHNIATISYRKGEYLDALELYLHAARILDSIGNTSVIILTYNNLSTLYTFYKQPEKALEYSKLCIEAAEKNNNQHMISVGSITNASVLIELGRFEEALPYINRAGEIARQRNDHYILGLHYINLSSYYCFWKNNYKKAIELNKKARQEADMLGNHWEILRTSTSLAELYYLNKQYDLAIAQAKEAQMLNKPIGSQDLEQRILKVIGKSLRETGQHNAAAQVLLQSMSLQDSVFNQTNQLQINYYEALYQKEKRELQITKLKSDKQLANTELKKRRLLNLSLISITVLILILSVLIYNTLRHKKIVAEKNLDLEKEKNSKLEKEQQLIATQAVLSGEETERRRLARDLHDGLGGMLSGIKLKLSNLKGNFYLDEEGKTNFDNAINSLDLSVTELRRVAHNLMPEVLIKYGLKEAISDFCSGLNKGCGVNTDFRFYGNDGRVDHNLEISIYRIIQELINNALKHSDAKQILVQLVQDDKRISITVQDDGKGFDLKQIDESRSVGLSSIKSRVAALSGIIDIYTAPNKGTEIEIEFEI